MLKKLNNICRSISIGGPSISCHLIVPLLLAKEVSSSTTCNLKGVSSLIVNDGIFKTIEATKQPNRFPFETTIPPMQQNLPKGFGGAIYR